MGNMIATMIRKGARVPSQSIAMLARYASVPTKMPHSERVLKTMLRAAALGLWVRKLSPDSFIFVVRRQNLHN